MVRVRTKPMKYQLSTQYAWYHHQEGSVVVLVYLIQDIPFTFDELPEIANNCPDVVKAADEGKRWTAEEMYRASNYLIMEECHPMLFDLEVDKPELLPVD